MGLNIILIIIGFIFLVKGADLLVDGASGFAKRLHIPEIVVGLTVVSIGTSMPELFVSITSAINGYEDMSMGNVIGSNICNLLLILGLSATISPIIFKKETKFIEIPICLFVTVLFMVLCNIKNGISKIDSIILIITFICFICYTVYMSKKGEIEPVIEVQTGKDRRIILDIFYILLGIIGLKIGGDFVVDNAESIARSFNISEKIISLTIIAVGTSLPELVTSVTSAIKGNSDIAIGNIIGSNIFNFLLIIGVTGIIRPISYSSSYNLQMMILVISTVVLALFPYMDRKDQMTRSNGITYLMLYALYMVLLFVQ